MAARMRTAAQLLKSRMPGSARRLIARHYKRIYSLLRHLCRNDADAWDLTMDTYIRAFESVHTLEDRSRLRPWLTSIAVNLFRHHYRREQVRKKWVDVSTELAEDYGDWRLNPEQELIVAEQNKALYQALNELPVILSQVLRLAVMDGRPLEEVALVEQTPVGTIKSRLNRAKEVLRRRLTGRKEIGR